MAADAPGGPSTLFAVAAKRVLITGGSRGIGYMIARGSRVLAVKLAAESITVNAVAPGPFDSKMMAFLLDDPAGRAEVAGSVPLGRVGRPDDMAGVALWLASRGGAFVTGAVIPWTGDWRRARGAGRCGGTGVTMILTR